MNDRDGGVEGGQQLEQIHEDAETQVPDGVRDRGADADRREAHHDARELEHRLGKALDEGQHRPPLRLRHHRQRDTEDHAEYHDLEHLGLDHGARNVSGKTSSTMSCQVRGAGGRSAGPRPAAAGDADPGAVMVIAAQPMSSASVVTTSK